MNMNSNIEANIGNMFHIEEPRLTFGYNQKLCDPRDGITLFGPYTRGKICGQLAIGIIGPSSCRHLLKEYLIKLHKPIFGDGEIARPFFPGIEAAYGVSINTANLPEIDVSQDEISRFLLYTDGYQRVYNLTNLYVEKLINYHKQEELPVNVWFVIIPDEVYTYGRPKSHIPSSNNNINDGLIRKERNSDQLFIFDFMNELRDAYDFEVNFHNQLKAKLLNNRIVTQVIRVGTIAYEKLWTDNNKIEAERKFDTAKAWNISTTLYYKVGGLPWRLGDVRQGVCYLGLVYKKTSNDKTDRNACCAAQMFLDSGDGVVFRGNLGPWFNPITKEYHLKKEDARNLLYQSLIAFKDRVSTPNGFPDEVFIHAKTDFDDEEWNGFLEAAEGKVRIVGVKIRENRVMKLYRDFEYSVPRGMALEFADNKAFLWTKGFIPRLQTQLGLETPNPLEIIVSRGQAKIDVVCKDILALTKLNYNACLYGEGLPVTLRFADRIGEVLTAGKNIETGVLPFKHYV